MNIEQLRALAEIVSQNQLTSLDLREGEFSVRIERTPESPLPALSPAGVRPDLPLQGVSPVRRPAEVRTPIVGVFYSASAPDAPPFVSIGSRVGKGDVLCIIEAMKQMNEITAESDGVIADICVRNGDIVEYDQVLFKLTEAAD